MHQWFGDNVSPELLERPLAQRGPGDVRRGAVLQRGRHRDRRYYNQWNTTAANSATWTVPAANPTDTDSSDLFGSHVYDRGAMALEALRTRRRPDDFLAIMKEWQVRYADHQPGTADFFALAEELSGKELTAFFQDWIYDADKPAWPGKFNLSLASDPASGTVAAGSPVSYTLSAANTGKVSLAGKVVDARPDRRPRRRHHRYPPGEHLAVGTTLTWNVPATAWLRRPASSSR